MAGKAPHNTSQGHWLIDWIVFYAVSAIFQPHNVGLLIESVFEHLTAHVQYYAISIRKNGGVFTFALPTDKIIAK